MKKSGTINLLRGQLEHCIKRLNKLRQDDFPELEGSEEAKKTKLVIETASKVLQETGPKPVTQHVSGAGPTRYTQEEIAENWYKHSPQRGRKS